MIAVLGYVATVTILLTYATGRRRAFDWANAIGCFPLLAGEALGHAWPAFVLTASFGAIGWWHVAH